MAPFGDRTPARVTRVRLVGMLGGRRIEGTRPPDEWNDVLGTITLRAVGDGRVHLSNICGDAMVGDRRIGAARGVTLQPGTNFIVNGLSGQVIDRPPRGPSQ